jgi:ABC-type nitrate/sulfonate/bicarbonate transport system substrate-binding protein
VTSERYGRRDILRRGVQGGAALGVMGVAGGLLAACGDDGGTTASTAAATGATTTAAAAAAATTTALPKYGKWTLQVNWLPGGSWASSYMANETGVYQKYGFDGGLDMLYGGPTVSVEPVIIQGKCSMGICNSETFAGAIRQGAKLVALGAYLQRNPFCIASLPSKPITKPEDMIGKKIGVQALNETLWSSLLKINKIDESKVTKVIVQNDPTPLVNGEVDGFLSFVNNQPVTLEFQKITPTIMMLADYGFSLYQQLYVVTEDNFKNKKDMVLAGLKSEAIGKYLLAADPAEGVRLTVEKYAKDQNPSKDYNTASLAKTFPLTDTANTKAKGLLYMSAEDIAKNVETLKLLGLEIPASSYNSTLLDEVYKNGTKLI